jgi:hypothetical protein
MPGSADRTPHTSLFRTAAFVCLPAKKTIVQGVANAALIGVLMNPHFPDSNT